MNEPLPPPPDRDDLALVQRVLAGDRRAFESLVRRHERRVYRVALAILGRPEDAEEAMQDAFIRALQHLGQFRNESRFTTWLTRIAVNEAIRKRAARKAAVPHPESQFGVQPFSPSRFELWQESPEKVYGRHELRVMVENAIQSLPEIYREVFVLRDVEEMNAEEAAGVLGITVPALKSRLLRARLMVRESLATKFEKPAGLRAKFTRGMVDTGTVIATRLMKAMTKQAGS